MNNKKYVLTENTKTIFDKKLYQIQAIRTFANVREGDFGGWIEKEENLSHTGNAWVSGNACVYGNAHVCENAWVSGDARVSGNVRVCSNARVYGDARVSSSHHIAWFSSVGSSYGTLTAYTNKNGEIEVTRGCFHGTLEELEEAVQKTHGNNRYGKEYRALIQFIRTRFRDIDIKVGVDHA